MRVSRRWFAAFWFVLGLLPSVERVLLAHFHGAASPELSAAAPHEAPSRRSGDAWLDCAACQARATLGTLALDAASSLHSLDAARTPLAGADVVVPPATRGEAPPSRGPPERIV